MISTVLMLLFVAGLTSQPVDWVADGNRALDRGKPEEAVRDFAQAIEEAMRGGASVADLVRLRVTLATAYMEAGRYRDVEAVLHAAERSAGSAAGIPRAELLNAWSALHLKIGRLPEAEAELVEARRIVVRLPDAGLLPATVLHNLAAVEMRTGRYSEALENEQEALRRFKPALSADHPTLIRAWASLASIQYMTGHVQDARVSIELALASAERTYGPAHPLIADLLESDAVVLDKLKLKKSAREARARARRIRGGPAPTGQDAMTRSVKEVTTSSDPVYLRSK